MPPSVVAKVISESAFLNSIFFDDLVPRMHMMDALLAAKDSLHLSQLIIMEYDFCRLEVSKSVAS